MRASSLWVWTSVCLVVALISGCGAEPWESPCGDASYWSGRAADWPAERVYVGGDSLALEDALALLERTPASGEEALVSALIVAELNLASGADDRLLPLVYEGHALLADGEVPDADARSVAEALQADASCAG